MAILIAGVGRAHPDLGARQHRQFIALTVDSEFVVQLSGGPNRLSSNFDIHIDVLLAPLERGPQVPPTTDCTNPRVSQAAISSVSTSGARRP